MGLDKGIRSGKEHRRQYRHSKAFDASCRNHGGCPWCEADRTYQGRKAELSARMRLEDDLD